jgi:hypothetical protein
LRAGHRPKPERTVASLTGGKTRRKLGFVLVVDPYATFEPLSAELTHVASASAIGETGSMSDWPSSPTAPDRH